MNLFVRRVSTSSTCGHGGLQDKLQCDCIIQDKKLHRRTRRDFVPDVVFFSPCVVGQIRLMMSLNRWLKLWPSMGGLLTCLSPSRVDNGAGGLSLHRQMGPPTLPRPDPPGPASECTTLLRSSLPTNHRTALTEREETRLQLAMYLEVPREGSGFFVSLEQRFHYVGQMPFEQKSLPDWYFFFIKNVYHMLCCHKLLS